MRLIFVDEMESLLYLTSCMMKSVTLVVGLVAIALCEGSVLSQSRRVQQPIAAENVMIDIIEDDRGIVTISGEFIYLRLYGNGRVEFEDLHRTELETWTFEKHEVRLKTEELEELLALTRQPDLLDAREEYKRIGLFDDMWTITRITFQHSDGDKRVVIRNYMPDHDRAKGYYPDSLSALMKKAQQIRKVYH